VNQTNPQPSTSPVIPVMILIGVFALMLALLLTNRTYVESTYVDPTTVVEAAPTRITSIVSNLPTYSAVDVAQGRTAFQGICAVCHGTEGQGVVGNGKPLVNSEFVDSLNDQELYDFIMVGRQPRDAGNTMPVRGGAPILSDEDIFKIVAFIRTLNDPSLISEDGGEAISAAATTAPEVATTTPVSGFVIVTTATPSIEATVVTSPTEIIAEIAEPESDYLIFCSGCHGVNDVPHLSDSPIFNDDDELYILLAHGQVEIDPSTGMRHPAYYNALHPDEIRALIEYIQTLGE
jgi:mono/diheme cytochrome c family protein